jgi:wyosine [tRNA(Phe)-imidazoG37] synthetase (radical SAM superfamily)
MEKHIFGPVPSRRLGLSLGIDLVPYKTCSLNCIYCECGKTTNLTITPKSWFEPDKIFKELQEKVNSLTKLDYITFSGSGEPTLSTDIGYLIDKIKSEFNIKVSVLTNGNLLYLDDVKQRLLKADIVMPSLDAVSDDIFQKINRPHPDLNNKKIIQGLIDFRKIYKNKIYLEILLVKGINDTESEIKKLSETADKIKPDKIQLNTCVRPGAEDNLQELSYEELLKVSAKFSVITEIAKNFDKQNEIKFDKKEIISMLERRPCSIRDLSSIMGIPSLQILKMIDYLKQKNVPIKKKKSNDQIYYYIKKLKNTSGK